MTNKFMVLALQVTVAAIVAVVLALTYVDLDKGNGLLWVLGLTVAISIAGRFLMARLDASYGKRIILGGATRWDVWVNDVKVGTVSDAQYAAMQRCAMHDGRTAVAQLLNIGRVGLVVLDKFFVAVPLMVFWGAIALAGLAPETYTAVVQELLAPDAESLTRALRASAQVIVLMTVFVVCGMSVAGYRFGFRDCYAAEVARMLRRECATPADGEVRLSRGEPDGFILTGQSPSAAAKVDGL